MFDALPLFMSPLPDLVSRDEVRARLVEIFPDGAPNQRFCTRELAASTVFTMLYVGAVEGSDRYLAPKHVYRMTAEQAQDHGRGARLAYAEDCLRPGFEAVGTRWYKDNTREPIRDETLREGLAMVGAVVLRVDMATTSDKPRYALAADFAALFDPALAGEARATAIAAWQQAHLTHGALARVRLERAGAVAATHGVEVTFPNGDRRRLAAGPSSFITKAVIEVFAPAFLERPAAIWLSESGNKVVQRDDAMAAAIGLVIRPDLNLPDIILADLGPQEPLLVFVEVVATDGPIHPRRRKALLEIAAAFRPENVAFVTAYMSRDALGFRKTQAQLAWRSFAWFASEPEGIVALYGPGSTPLRLSDLSR